MNTNAIDKVVTETLAAIEKGKVQIYEIVENTQTEYIRVKDELDEMRKEVSLIISRVDALTIKEKRARLRLMDLHRNFRRFSEEEIKKAYEEAQKLQLQLQELRNQEVLLCYKRDHLEQALRRLNSMRHKAENMATQLGTVFNYLSTDIQNLNNRVGELQQMHQLGLSIIRAQEEERKRVARDIHDGPAQLMANIVMRAEFILKLLDIEPGKVREEMVALQKLVRQSLRDVRKVIFDLRPMVLDDLGLLPAIKRYAEEYQSQYNLSVKLIILGAQQRFATAIEVALFRVIQESLSNIRKHSNADRVLIKIEVLPKKINVGIKDNGCGFNLNTIMTDAKREGYGLIGMRERIQILKGQFTVNTAPGKGTSIYITVPLDVE